MPATSAPAKPKETAFAVKPQLTPKWSTMKPPSGKPTMIAMLCVRPTKALAPARLRSGTRFGIAAMKAGTKIALPMPSISDTA